MFDLTAYVKKWRIRQLKTVFSTLDTLCTGGKTVFRNIKSFLSVEYLLLQPIIPAPTTATDPADSTIATTTFNWTQSSRSTTTHASCWLLKASLVEIFTET